MTTDDAGSAPLDAPVRPAPGWAIETGVGDFGDKGERWACVRNLESQCGQDFYEDRDRLMFHFLLAVEAETLRLKDAVRSARADEAHCWASRVDSLTAQLREADARYMALLKFVADGRAMQPAPAIVVDLGPNVRANLPP